MTPEEIAARKESEEELANYLAEIEQKYGEDELRDPEDRLYSSNFSFFFPKKSLTNEIEEEKSES